MEILSLLVNCHLLSRLRREIANQRLSPQGRAFLLELASPPARFPLPPDTRAGGVSLAFPIDESEAHFSRKICCASNLLHGPFAKLQLEFFTPKREAGKVGGRAQWAHNGAAPSAVSAWLAGCQAGQSSEQQRGAHLSANVFAVKCGTVKLRGCALAREAFQHFGSRSPPCFGTSGSTAGLTAPAPSLCPFRSSIRPSHMNSRQPFPPNWPSSSNARTAPGCHRKVDDCVRPLCPVALFATNFLQPQRAICSLLSLQVDSSRRSRSCNCLAAGRLIDVRPLARCRLSEAKLFVPRNLARLLETLETRGGTRAARLGEWMRKVAASSDGGEVRCNRFEFLLAGASERD